MKIRAGGLLVVAALVFVASYIWGAGDGWWGYVRAAAEAAMVGGVADWFAVTALFRHPLGIPIPHTALIPRGKDAIGRGLGEFIERNFVDTDGLVERIDTANPARRLGTWLRDPEHATAAAQQATVIISGVTEALADEDIQAGIQEAVTDRLKNVEVGPIIGSVTDWAIEGNHHQTIVSAALQAAAKGIDDNQQFLRARLGRESPWWVPGTVDDAVFHKLYDAIQSFLAEMADDPDHHFRKQLDVRAIELARDLQTSPELMHRAEALRDELLQHPDFQTWIDGLWTDMKATIADAAETPDSALHQRPEAAFRTGGLRLETDTDLQHKVNTWIVALARQVAEQSGGEVARLVASTVQRWDARETSRRLELQVGRDLQFIRINGTLVGGLVGVIIHALIETFG